MCGLRTWPSTRPGLSSITPGARCLVPSLLIVVLFLLGPASTAAVSGLSITGQVAVNGMAEGDANGGAIRVHTSSGVPTMQAEALTLDLRWRSGTAGGPPGNEDYAKYSTDSGSLREAFENVSVRIEPFGGPLELLLEHEAPSRFGGVGNLVLPPDLPPYLVRVGQSPATQSASGDAPFGFWYAPDPAWTMAHGLDQAHLTGDASLFVNNATVTITRGQEVLWKNWTGYARSQETPLTHRYDERLLRFNLTGSSIDLGAPDGITLLGPALTLDVTGVVSTPGAQGVLEQGSRRILFDGGPLELKGEGTISIDRSAGPAERLTLSVLEAKGFRVEGGAHVPVETGPREGVPPGTWLGVAGLAVVTGGAAAAWRSPALQKRWRTSRYEHWSRRGHDLADERRFAAAATAFERATRADPARAMGWYQLALARLEAGHYEQTLALVERARDHGVDELDLLEVQVEAALRAGLLDQCRDALSALADGSLTMAESLARDLTLGPDVLGPELTEKLGRDDHPGGLPGYV